MRFPIIPLSKIWFTLSGLLVAASLFFILSPSFGLRLGIDFTGGSKMYLSFAENITREEFTEIFTAALGEKGQVVVSSGENGVIVRSRTLSNEEITQLEAQLALSGKTLDQDQLRVETVGPTQGKVQTKNAFIAIALAIFVIIVFVAIAFRKVPQGISSWKLGVVTVIALAHDVLIVAGFFALLGKFYGVEIDTLFITALLTVLGWSVNDTIVVFDRIRENLKGAALAHLPKLAEDAVWQTMARSLHTSVSTLIVLGAILFAHIDGIHFFVMALAAGIIVGTYSSIFLATPLLVIWMRKK